MAFGVINWMDGNSRSIWMDGNSQSIWMDGNSQLIWMDGNSQLIWMNEMGAQLKIIDVKWDQTSRALIDENRTVHLLRTLIRVVSEGTNQYK
jgi:hypothetical protein